MSIYAELITKFSQHFEDSKQPVSIFFAPGRVNLIGEYTDFNGGYVFPAAVSLGIWGILRRRADGVIRLHSDNAASAAVIDLEQPLVCRQEDGWINYPKGVMKYLMDHGLILQGCDILFSGNLPTGAGLSSSAALLILTAYMLQTTFGNDRVDRVAMAQLCRKVENEFIGVNCGIMDHFAIAMGHKNHAILLNCNTLAHKYIPLSLDNHRLVIMNTNKKRELTDSKYNERRQECDLAVAIIRKHRHIEHLCQATLAEVESLLEQPVLRKRARHVVSENQRVIDAVALLRAGEIDAFGGLMIASHQSLQADFEVSGFELDVLVEHALQVPGCIGARMTGAGFGGCAIALVEKQALDEFVQQVRLGYQAVTGRFADFYPAIVADGVAQGLIYDG
jgi:galactokinase